MNHRTFLQKKDILSGQENEKSLDPILDLDTLESRYDDVFVSEELTIQFFNYLNTHHASEHFLFLKELKELKGKKFEEEGRKEIISGVGGKVFWDFF